MAIDMEKLRKAAEGDPTAKVTVNKAWLAEVHKTIKELQSPKSVKRDDHMSSVFDHVFGRKGRRR